MGVYLKRVPLYILNHFQEQTKLRHANRPYHPSRIPGVDREDDIDVRYQLNSQNELGQEIIQRPPFPYRPERPPYR